MRRQNYYRPSNNSRADYQQKANRSTPNNQGPVYNNYGPQRPYYPERPHHHIFMWIVIIILCLGLGWFAADHFLGSDSSQAGAPASSSSAPQTTVNHNNKTVNNNNNNKQSVSQQSTSTNKLVKEMNRLDVSSKDQQTAINFYQKQSPKNQAKMNQAISMVNHLVPSDTLKRELLNKILQ